MRILFILVLLAVGYILLKSWLRKRHIQTNQRDKTTATKLTQRMVRCEQCELHVPETEAIRHGGHYFCCQEHARLAPPSKA